MTKASAVSAAQSRNIWETTRGDRVAHKSHDDVERHPAMLPAVSRVAGPNREDSRPSSSRAGISTSAELGWPVVAALARSQSPRSTRLRR